MAKGKVQLLRAAVTVTSIYLITFTYIFIYYTFGTLGIWWSFVIQSPTQQVSLPPFCHKRHFSAGS